MLLPKIYKKPENPSSPATTVQLEESKLPPEESGAKQSQLFSPIFVDLEDNATLVILKRAISKQWHMHPKQLILYLSGQMLDDNNKLLRAYGISSGSLVHVVLQSATISLVIACPNGQKVRIDHVDLNMQIENLRGKITTDLKNQDLVTKLRLYFIEKEVNWKNQLRFIEELEDGSELSTGIRLHLVLISLSKVRYPKVDLNWSIKTLKENLDCFTAHQKRFLTLIYKDNQLTDTTILRNIPNFDDDADIRSRLEEDGGF